MGGEKAPIHGIWRREVGRAMQGTESHFSCEENVLGNKFHEDCPAMKVENQGPVKVLLLLSVGALPSRLRKGKKEP